MRVRPLFIIAELVLNLESEEKQRGEPQMRFTPLQLLEVERIELSS